MDLLSVFASGLFGSIMVCIITLYWEKHKTQQILKGHALLLFSEINDQLYRLKNLDELSVNSLLTVPDVEWESCKHFLAANISYDNFRTIHMHYRSMISARKILSCTLKEHGHGIIPNDQLHRFITNAENAQLVLIRIIELNKQQIERYNINKPH